MYPNTGLLKVRAQQFFAARDWFDFLFFLQCLQFFHQTVFVFFCKICLRCFFYTLISINLRKFVLF